MTNILEFISRPWHWAVSGAMITLVMVLLLWFGGQFSVSSNLRTMCAIGGAGNRYEFFKFNWKDQVWNLIFIGGAVIGGFIATQFLASPEPVQIAESTTDYLETMGIHTSRSVSEGAGYVPEELFGLEKLFSVSHLLFLVVGGFLVGFGTRWAGGCTSGHAISGLSNLQLPSLIAVIGFFIGGLLMTWLILPQLLSSLNPVP